VASRRSICLSACADRIAGHRNGGAACGQRRRFRVQISSAIGKLTRHAQLSGVRVV
jgi:hypothetical protein